MNTYRTISSCLLISLSELNISATNMKLQKLMYYVQGFSLAVLDKPAFKEDFEAWRHGPVVEELYQDYKMFGSSILPVPQDDHCQRMLTNDQLSLIELVVHNFGYKSASELRKMTHAEGLWNSHSNANDGGDRTIIRKDEIKQFFANVLSMPDEEVSRFINDVENRISEGAGSAVPKSINSFETFMDWALRPGR